jgi:hypothetical protein
MLNVKVKYVYRSVCCTIHPSACSLINTYSRYALITPPIATPPRLLNVDARAVAVDGVLSRSTGEWLSSLLEDYDLVSELSKPMKSMTHTDQVLAVDGVTLVLRKVVEEQLDVGVER